MSLLRFGAEPFDNILRLQRALTRSLENPFFGLGTTPSARGVFPALNIFEEEGGEAIVLKAEVPGMKRDSLEVEAVGNRLSIAGVREIPSPEGDFRYHRRERQAGEFRRVFRLPYDVDREKALANYHDGVLTVRLEKAEAAKTRQIQISG
jgi:HSP20 family protein